MARSAHSRGPSSPARQDRDRLARVRLQRLRHLHPVGHARQLALVATLRAARAQPEHATAHVRSLAAPTRPAAEPVGPPAAGTPWADQCLAALAPLRAFAVSLTKDASRADDLVQDTLLRAWAHQSRFQPGTNLEAWLFTILRNSFYSEHRQRQREVEDPDGTYAGRLIALPEQEARLMMNELRGALAKLSPAQREAIVLVAAHGTSYEEAAALCGVAIGTVKSRVNRARERLAALLQVHDHAEIGPDRVMTAALQGMADRHP